MASRQTVRSLPNDQETLRFYLDGVHHFVHWSELEIAALSTGIQGQFGRVFLAFQQILKPYLHMGKEGTGMAIHPSVIYPSASSENPFEVTTAFSAIQPFLDCKEVTARLADCRAAVEAIEQIPSSLTLVDRSFGERHPLKIGRIKEPGKLNADKKASCERQHASPSQVRAKQEAKRNLHTAFAAFEAMLDPFRNLAQRIVLKLAGTDQPTSDGQDESGYLPAKMLKGIDKRVNSDKRLTAVLKNNPGIRRRRPLTNKGTPWKQRLDIYVADLIRFLYEKDSAEFGEADASSDADKAKSKGKAESKAKSKPKTALNPDADERRQDVLKSHGVPVRPYDTRPDLDNRQ